MLHTPKSFTFEDAAKEWNAGGRIYVSRLRTSTYIRLRVPTARPMMWYILFDGGQFTVSHWGTGAIKMFKQVAQRLLETSALNTTGRAKLELLLMYCDEKDKEKRAEIAELFYDLRKAETGTRGSKGSGLGGSIAELEDQ